LTFGRPAHLRESRFVGKTYLTLACSSTSLKETFNSPDSIQISMLGWIPTVAETHRDDATRVDPERRVADLLGVLEAARRLAMLTELSPLVALVEQSARRLLDCERVTLFLHDPQSDELVSRATGEPDETRLPVGRGLVGEVFHRKVLVNSSEPANGAPPPAAIDRRHALAARSVLACPLLAGDEATVGVGVLLALDAHRDRFDDWDEVVARALAAQAGVAIYRQRLGDPDRAHRFERDLDVARQIQQALLPRRPPALEGYDIAGWYQPADETGGDFFDFQDRGDGRLAVAVGDVSGHGVGPALVAAECRAFLRATLLGTDEPSPVITQVNQLLCRDQFEDRFVTAFFGILRHDTHRLDYVSAGQGPILFYAHGGGPTDELEIQGFPLGLSAELAFGPPRTIAFAPGDFLALITDGFFEWFNARGECFGIERMKAQIDRDRDRPAAEIIQSLYATVLDFADSSPQPDDLTAVVIKRLA
jgi:phosphoserine phosphatase